MRLFRKLSLWCLCLLFGGSGLIGCGGSGSYTLDQQASVVQFPKQLNTATDNLNEALKAANLSGKVSARTLDIQTLGALAQKVGEYQSQVNAISVPTDMPELAELKSAVQDVQSQAQILIQQMRSAIQLYNAAELSSIAAQLSQLSSNYKKPQQLEESILSKYRIPDSYVGYSRN